VLDTLRLICKARPTKEQLTLLWLRREDTICDAQAKCDYYYNPDKKDEVQVRATYRPKGRVSEDQFSLEFSPPKLVFGNNHEMILNLAPALSVTDLDPAPGTRGPQL